MKVSREVFTVAREVFTVIYKPRIEQFDWSIHTRHGRSIYIVSNLTTTSNVYTSVCTVHVHVHVHVY